MQVSSSEQPQKMKFKIIFLCLVFFFSFSLVSGFIESEPIHLNMDFSSPQNGENSIIEITINETGIETDKNDNPPPETLDRSRRNVNSNINPLEQKSQCLFIAYIITAYLNCSIKHLVLLQLFYDSIIID